MSKDDSLAKATAVKSIYLYQVTIGGVLSLSKQAATLQLDDTCVNVHTDRGPKSNSSAEHAVICESSVGSGTFLFVADAVCCFL